MRKVLSEPFSSSTKGSFEGNFREPQSTECSMIWGRPVLSGGGVRKPIMKTLSSSRFSNFTRRAPLFTCSNLRPLEPISFMSWISVSLKP
ncbi:MAG: hypothetical protein BWX47_01593 [candidate division Hyd24-12 bacterium ADurb.Bin004]|nr:MAG: hypothetical protein BWX47_01593 [candidate division Hyd24-12 bacterium ADurb.Bin004]